MRLFLLVLVLVFFIQSVPVFAFQTKPFNPRETEYKWPTNASKLISASFGETRSAHFHAAIDVKTWGRVGFELYATRDGILSRVARSPLGYGNVIYLKHDDGSYSVYAHMDRFIKKIEQLVDSLRWENRVFVFDESMEKYGIYFKKGELIGYSGASGAGPAHIHFELRTPTESPFNPLLTSIKIKDTRAPRFSALAIEPLDIKAKVEGEKKVFIKNARATGRNFDFGTIDVQGEVGLAVDAFDQADGAANVLAVYELELRIENEILFHSRIDSFSYSGTRQMFLDRVYSILKKRNRGFQRLYRRDGNELPFYEIAKPNAKLNLPVGLHSYEIIARDFYGNQTKAYGRLNVLATNNLAKEETKLFESLKVSSKSTYPKKLEDWDWQNDWVKPEGDHKSQTEINLRSLDFNQVHKRISISQEKEQAINLEAQGSVLLSFDKLSVLLHRIKPGFKTTVLTPDQLMTVRFGKDAVYDTLSLTVGHVFNDTLGVEMIYVLPEQEPLKRGFSIELILDESYTYPEKTSFYKYNFRTRKVDFSQSTAKQNTITASLRDFGVYHVLQDTIPPTLERPKLYRKSGGKWAASVKGKDNLSGIDYNRSRFSVNGEEGILEYDPEEDRIVYYHPKFKPLRRNEFLLEVYDLEGNKVVETFTVRL